MRRENDLDNFNPNENNTQQDDRGKNDFFRNRGGHTYSGGGFNMNRNNFNNNPRFNQGRRDNDMNGERPNFNRNGYGGRPHNYYNNYNRNNYNNNYQGYRDRGFPRPYYNNYNDRGYNTDRRYGNNNPNFNREFQREENDMENNYTEEREAKLERDKILSEFKKKFGKIIDSMKGLFVNESLKEEQIIDILQSVTLSPNLTIFEVMNMIYRQVQIIKTLQLDKSMRQYGPDQDILEFEFEQNNLNKKNLTEVIQKYKIYKKEEEENNKEKNDMDNNNNNINININNDELKKGKDFDKYWFYIDDFDKRRKLVKDEEGYFNYVPIMNPEGENNNKDEDDIYAKNENEISYHALFYKTLMCKECPKNNNNEKMQLLCPYAHDILKDFRIIYKYTDEDVCKFMILLQESKLFSFQNYLNYIPMSLKPEFNIDTFKVHKCQLDSDCPNDYHVCPYYHKSVKVDEVRRPPLLFGYIGSTGDICFNQRRSEYCPEHCPCGIFCRYVHSKNEFNYHQDHFRKEFECKRPKDKNGKCIYINTCYGKHKKEEYNKIINEEKEEEFDKDKLNSDEEVQQSKNKVENIFNIAKAFRCRKCQNVESHISYFTLCKHFLCVKCCKKLFNENKKKERKNKKDKEKNEKNNFMCPFCDKEITNNTIIHVEF